ncbi:hypothetical protein Avbf_05179 [Armadillidium vulgare]|nr:hypothetical protein Avbf_05179 [Armadillidium vulgare]
MTNAYLALRWNNHHTIFTKVLNHLREQGEVHVPQSELGSLLRTAEALQVKGLAVPDDTTQSPKKSPTSSDSAPTVPLLKSFPVKRKKTTEGNRQEELPKLTPSQALSATKVKSKSNKNLLSSLPVLKRFKASFEENASHNTSSTSNPGENNANVNHNCNSNSQSSEEPSSENRESVMSTANSQEQNGLIPISMIKEEVLESNCDEEQPLEEEEENTSFDQENDGEGQYYIDEEEDEEGADGQDGAIEGDENSSLPNSELSTSNIMGDNFLQTELLQVDLSEDGTQFIIGPGVIGGEASRASSVAEEETEGPKKPFLCVLCGHTFTRRDNLANHLKVVEWIYDCISKYKRFDSDFEKLLITCRLFFVIVMHFWQFSRSKWATKFLHRHRPALRFELQNMNKRYYKYGMFVMFGSFISPVLSSMRMDRFRDFGIAYVIINLEQISLYLIALATSATNNLIINKLKDEVFKFLKAISKPNTNCQSRNCHEHHKENVIVNDYEEIS